MQPNPSELMQIIKLSIAAKTHLLNAINTGQCSDQNMDICNVICNGNVEQTLRIFNVLGKLKNDPQINFT